MSWDDPDRGGEPDEVRLFGGRITPGVVRVGDTVRRPVRPHSEFVHQLLSHLEAVGFEGAPRYFGIDAKGRECLSYIDGVVPDNIDAGFTDNILRDAADQLRRFHEATAGSKLAGSEEVVCHNDISPVNTVFVSGRPAALIDFDMARPGSRIRDVSYGMFLWLNLGWDGRSPTEQRRRIRLWCDAYGPIDTSTIIDEVKLRVVETVRRHGGDGSGDAASWWQQQLDWLERHQPLITP